MSESTHDPDGPNMWTQPRFVIAAVVVALIAVMAVVLAVTGPSGGDSTAAPTPTDSATQSSTTKAPPASDSACGLEPTDQTVPVAPPPDTEWELVGTVVAPTAPETIGPGVVDDGLRSCFARSPLGALYAASNFLASTSDPDLRVRVVTELTAEGGGREAAIEAVTSQPPGGTGTGLQIVGFSILNFDEDVATVDVAFELDAAALHLPIPLRWEAGDWKVLMPPDGDLYAGIQSIPDFTGYVPWAGA